MKLKQWIAILLACVMLASVPAGLADAESVLNIGGSVTLAALGPFQSMTICGAAFYTLYETLGNRGPNGEMIGCIAKEWKPLDEVNYEVTIYDNVYDSVGNHITAADVVYCYEQMLSVMPAATYDTLEYVDDTTFHIHMVSNTIGAIEAALLEVPIVSKAEYEKSADMMASNPVSSSHYVVSDFVPGTSLSFVRNEDYWQKDESLIAPNSKANYDKVNFLSIPEASQQTIALVTGKIDVMESMDVSQMFDFLEGGSRANDYTVISGGNVSGTIYTLYFSGTENSLLRDDVNLRKAILHAIDRNGVAMGSTGGLSSPCNMYGIMGIAPEDYPDYYDAEGGYNTYDVELAKEYLAKSNYQGQKLRFLSYSGDKISQIISSYLSVIGVQVEISTPDLAIYQQNYADPTGWDLSLCRNSVDYNTNFWYKQYRTNANGVNRHGWADTELSELATYANTVNGHTQENVNKVSRMLDEQAYGEALYIVDFYCVSNNDVKISDVIWTRTHYIPYWACSTK